MKFSKHSKCIMNVVASQAAVHVPCTVTASVALAPLAGKDSRCRASIGISAGRHELTAPAKEHSQTVELLQYLVA